MVTPINTAFLKMAKRAEKYDNKHLVSTFVDVGPLFTLLTNIDHQILYGRRGTGKTHALKYLGNEIKKNNDDIIIYADLRMIGSTGGIYNSNELSLSERATRLLVDTLTEIHDNLMQYAIEHEEFIDLSRFGSLLDEFADSITEVIVEGKTEKEIRKEERQQYKNETGLELTVKTDRIEGHLKSTDIHDRVENEEFRQTKYGIEKPRLHFGRVLKTLKKIMSVIKPKRLWIMLDEWSEIPTSLQPYLADLLRKTLFPLENITVKIAAIEQRSNFRLHTGEDGYIGIELGADTDNLNLDEFMVFDNDKDQAKNFFMRLIFRHVKSILSSEKDNIPDSPEKLINDAFTQKNTFDELVRAAEGVPRDGINILARAAQKANNKHITMDHIREAARNWYIRAKEKSVSSNPKALKLLRWIIDEVIKHRQARAFLIKRDENYNLIDYLFDARILHVVKKSISGRDEPGVRYKVYSIDYGCYVDLSNTSQYPKGLFSVDTEKGEKFVEVPENDYRSIRRAILDVDEFESVTN